MSGLRRQQAAELRALVGLTDAQTLAFEQLSADRLQALVELIQRTAADSRVIRSFLDRAAREPKGAILRLPRLGEDANR